MLTQESMDYPERLVKLKAFLQTNQEQMKGYTDLQKASLFAGEHRVGEVQVKTIAKDIARLEGTVGKRQYQPSEPIVELDGENLTYEGFIRFLEKRGIAFPGASKPEPQPSVASAPTPNQFNIPGTHFLLPCVHAPFHNKRLMNGVLELLVDLGSRVKGLHLMGDFADVNSLSAHDRGMTPIPGVSLGWEYDQTNVLLDELEAALDTGAVKTYLWGNHEDRHKRYMRGVDNAKLGNSLPSPTIGLKLRERGYHVYENWKEDFITLGKYLDVMHGEFCTVHAAKKHLDVYRKSLVMCHTHRQGVYIEGNMGAYNIGSMADFTHPAFGYATRAMKSSWSNCFATVDIDSDGYYFVTPITFYNGKFFYNGKSY